MIAPTITTASIICGPTTIRLNPLEAAGREEFAPAMALTRSLKRELCNGFAPRSNSPRTKERIHPSAVWFISMRSLTMSSNNRVKLIQTVPTLNLDRCASTFTGMPLWTALHTALELLATTGKPQSAQGILLPQSTTTMRTQDGHTTIRCHAEKAPPLQP